MASDLLQNLPPPWNYGVTDDGRIFFIDEENRITTWLHPTRNHPMQSGFTSSSDLPRGWEKSMTPEGAPYYIDHVNGRTTFYHPITHQSAAVNIPLDNSQYGDQYQQETLSSPGIRSLPKVTPIKKVIDSTPSSPKVPEAEVTLRGWLYKQERGALKSWKRRWCVLADYCLLYYKDRSHETGLASGSILLPSYKVSPCTKEDNISRRYAFKAEHANMKTHYFAAENESEMSQWIYHLSLATNFQRDPSILAQKEHHREQNNNITVKRDDGGFGDRWTSPLDKHILGDSDSNSYQDDQDDGKPPLGEHDQQTSDLSDDPQWYNSPGEDFQHPPPYQDRDPHYPNTDPSFVDHYQYQEDSYNSGHPDQPFRDSRDQDRLGTLTDQYESPSDHYRSVQDQYRADQPGRDSAPHSRQSSNASSQLPWQPNISQQYTPSPYKYDSSKVTVLDVSVTPHSPNQNTIDQSDASRVHLGSTSQLDPNNSQNNLARNLSSSFEIMESSRLLGHRGSLDQVPALLPRGQPVKHLGSLSSVESMQRLQDWQDQMKNSGTAIPGDVDLNYHSNPIYENLVNASQNMEDAPSRPPLPVQYWDQIARDLAEAKTPLSRNDMLTAAERERLRPLETPVFQYPEPQVPNSQNNDAMYPETTEKQMYDQLQQPRYHPEGQDSQDGPSVPRTDPYYTPTGLQSGTVTGRVPFSLSHASKPSLPYPYPKSMQHHSSSKRKLNVTERQNLPNRAQSMLEYQSTPISSAVQRLPPAGGPADKGSQPESPFIPINRNQRDKTPSGPLFMKSEEAPLQHPKAQFARPLSTKDKSSESRGSLCYSSDDLYASDSKELLSDRKPGVLEIPGHSQSKSAFHMPNSKELSPSKQKVILMKSDTPKTARKRLEDEYPNIDTEPATKSYSVASIRGPDFKLLSRQRPKSMPGPDYDLSVTNDFNSKYPRRPRSMEGLLGNEFTGKNSEKLDDKNSENSTSTSQSRLQQKLISPVKKRARSLERGMEYYRLNSLDGAVSDSEATRLTKKNYIIDDFSLSFRDDDSLQRSKGQMLHPLHIDTQFESPETMTAALPTQKPRPKSIPYSMGNSRNMNLRPFSLATPEVSSSYIPKWGAKFENKANWSNTPPWREAAQNKAYINSVFEVPKPKHRKTKSLDSVLDNEINEKVEHVKAKGTEKGRGVSGAEAWEEDVMKRAKKAKEEEIIASVKHLSSASFQEFDTGNERYETEPMQRYATEPEQRYDTEPIQRYETKPVQRYETEPVQRYETEPVQRYVTEPINRYDTQLVQHYQHESQPVPRTAAPLSPSLSKRQGGDNTRHNISTIKEDPDMPDEDILDTKTIQELQSHLKDPRMRLSISAADLVGKSHEELVLLLIQLRRSQSRLQDVRNWYRSQLDVSREYEKEYKKQRNDSIGRLNEVLEEEHEHYQILRKQNNQLEKQLDVNKPLVNLVDNLVTMGSLYGGNNLLYAAEYKQYIEALQAQHQGSRDYQAKPGEITPKRLIEFSRQYQEEKLQQEQEEGIRQLTEDEANLEEKLQQLFELDRELQDQSFTVTSLQEDRELLEKALSGIKEQEEREDNGRVLSRLHHQRQTVQNELTKVRQQLADAFKLLEEKSTENARVEQEVVLLRKKIAQGLARNAMSSNMGGDTVRARQQLEREVTNIQTLMADLSLQGAKISQAMRTLHNSNPDLTGDIPPHYVLVTGKTYAETDLDSMETFDLANNKKLDIFKKSTSVSSLNQPPRNALDPNQSPWTPDSYIVKTSMALQQKIQQQQPRMPPAGAEPQPQGHFQGQGPYQSQGYPQGHYQSHPSSQEEYQDQNHQQGHFPGNFQGQGIHKNQSPKTNYKTHDVPRLYSQQNQGQPQGYGSLGVLNIPGGSENQHYYRDISDAPVSLQFMKSAPVSQSASVLYENLTTRDGFESEDQMGYISDQYSPRDIQEADENTKKFYGIIPKDHKPKYTVRDVKKRESERKGRDKVKRLSNGDDTSYPEYKNIPSLGWTKMERSQSFPHSVGQYEEPLSSQSHNTDFRTYNPPNQPFSRNDEKRLSATERLFPNKALSQEGDRSGSSSSVNQMSRLIRDSPHRNSTGNIPWPHSGPDFFRASPATVATVRPVQNSQFMPTSNTNSYDWGTASSRDKRPRRHQTISSSEPVRLELTGKGTPRLPNKLGHRAPEVVKSDTALDREFDDLTIEKEVLYMPQKVEIPERYVPDSDEELVTEEELQEREDKADRIRKMLAAHSLQEWSQDELEKATPDVHHKVELEKRQRETILDIRGALAKEVTRKSRQIAGRSASFNKQKDGDSNMAVGLHKPSDNLSSQNPYQPLSVVG